jgi:peptidoglycan hydrolase CwlO-like protein
MMPAIYNTDIVMTRRNPRYFYIVATILLAAILCFYFYTTPDSIQEPITEQDYKEHKQKVAEYGAYLNEKQSQIDELDRESDQLKELDRDLDEKIRQLDNELGITPEEFEKQYPGFNMNGDSQ